VKSTKTKSGTTKRKADDDSEEDIEKEKAWIASAPL